MSDDERFLRSLEGKDGERVPYTKETFEAYRAAKGARESDWKARDQQFEAYLWKLIKARDFHKAQGGAEADMLFLRRLEGFLENNREEAKP